MPKLHTHNGDTFEMFTDMIDVTSLHRPDISWKFTDTSGHTHQWFTKGEPAKSYWPDSSYDTPSLVWVKDGEECYEDDDEPHDVGHWECRECGQHVERGFTADTCRQEIPGLRHYRVNGSPVSEDEFRARVKAAKDNQ